MKNKKYIILVVPQNTSLIRSLTLRVFSIEMHENVVNPLQPPKGYPKIFFNLKLHFMKLLVLFELIVRLHF